MSAPLTGRRKLAIGDFTEDTRGGLGGFYFSCDSGSACDVYQSGAGLFVGEPLSWDGGSTGILDSVNGTTEFIITDISGTKPVIGDTIVGELSGASVVMAGSDAYDCVSDKINHLGSVGTSVNGFPTSPTTFESGGVMYGLTNIPVPPGQDNFIVAYIASVSNSAEATSTILDIGAATTTPRIRLSGIATQIGIGTSLDVTSDTAGLLNTGSSIFFVCLAYIDQTNKTLTFYRYAPGEATNAQWVKSPSTTLSSFTGWSSTDNSFSLIRPSKGVVFMNPVKAGLTEDEIKQAMIEWFDYSVGTTKADERIMFSGKTGLFRLVSPDHSGGL